MARFGSDPSILIAFCLMAMILPAAIRAEQEIERGEAPVAIQVVLARDSELGKIRNHAPEAVPIATAVRDYVAGLDAIDFNRCPPEFTVAFRRHRDAWLASIDFFERHAELRGEMHDVFDEIRNLGGEEAAQLKRVEKAIWDTWGVVEAAAERHGMTETADGP